MKLGLSTLWTEDPAASGTLRVFAAHLTPPGSVDRRISGRGSPARKRRKPISTMPISTMPSAELLMKPRVRLRASLELLDPATITDGPENRRGKAPAKQANSRI